MASQAAKIKGKISPGQICGAVASYQSSQQRLAELLLQLERELPGACAELRAAGQAGDWEARRIAWDRAHDLMRWIEILKRHV